MTDFDARSRSGHSSSGNSGLQSSPEVASNVLVGVPALQGELDQQGTAVTPSPMHLSSFLDSQPGSQPIPETSSSDTSMHQSPNVSLTQSRTAVLHNEAHVHDNRSLHQHLQLQQSNMHVSADPLIVAQAAVEVDLARRQTQEVYDQASREIAATRALAQEEVLRQTREVIHQASQEVDASRAVAEREFHKLQSQVGALMEVIESQRDTIEKQRLTITNLQQQGSQNQPKETKSPSNGAGLAPTPSLGSGAQQSTTREPEHSSHRPREVNPQAFLNPSGSSGGVVQRDRPVPDAPQYFPISTPRTQTDPGIQSQLDLLTAQIASLTSAMSYFASGAGGRSGNADSATPKVAGRDSDYGVEGELGQGISSPISLVLRRPPGPPSSGSSSNSESEKGKGKKEKKGRGSSDKKSSSSTSSSSDSDDAYKQEKQAMRIKSYDTMKLAPIPKTAAEARGFRNQVFSAVTKLAKTDETPLLHWISATQSAGHASEFDDSGAYPLLDRVLGYKLLEAARGTKFSLDFQAVQETSQRLGYQPRGRLLLWMVFQRYRLEKDRGAALTQHHLLSLTVAGNDVKGLEDFKQKFNYVWEALDANERPTDNGVRSLLFEQLKNHPKMALHIDKYRNSSSSSSKRTWKWLYQKMQEVIEISHLDENTAAIDRALASKTGQNVPGNPAPKNQETAKSEKEKQKEKEHREREKKEKDKEKKKEKAKEKKEKARAAAAAAASEAATPTPATPAKGKGKGKDKPKSPRTREEKAKLPCMYFAYDSCTRGDKCEYIHDKNNLYKGPKPRGLKANAGAATVAAGVAMASVLPTAEGLSRNEGQCGDASLSAQDSSKHVQGVADRVKEVGSKLFKTGRKAKLSGNLLPKGSLFARAFTTVMTAMACLDPATSVTGMANLCNTREVNPLGMEFLLDSGAGRNLISKRHLPEETHGMFSRAPERLQFSTGGGTRSGSQAVRMKGDLSGDNVFYSLKECPPALSVGIQVNEH